MISFLEGVVDDKAPTRVLLNVGGVGYEVLIPLSVCDRLPAPGEKCRILTYLHVREDAHILYGFSKEDERELFTLLLGVSGIGPKLAMTALSGMTSRELKASIVQGDVKRLSSISGIGKKTAERIVVELRDKFGPAESLEAVAGADDEGPLDGRARDAMMALIALGYKQAEAQKMVQPILAKAGPDVAVEDVVRAALGGK